MQAHQASITAEVIAAARAIESCRPERVRLFHDPFAHLFLSGPRLRRLVKVARLFRAPDAANWLLDRISGVPGLYMSFCCRTRSIDDALSGVLDAGCRQVVILGAGYDSRAYRIPGIERARIFEVDHAATQEFKRTRLQRLVAQTPSHVVFVPVDFNRDDLRSKLEEAGFRAGDHSFFIWEGVTQYIRPESVDATLNFVVSASALGSRIALTYVHIGAIDGSAGFRGANKLTSRAREVGEPWVFGLRPEEIPEFLRLRGLTLIEDLGTAEHQHRYLKPLRRGGPLPDFTHVVIAELA